MSKASTSFLDISELNGIYKIEYSGGDWHFEFEDEPELTDEEFEEIINGVKEMNKLSSNLQALRQAEIWAVDFYENGRKLAARAGLEFLERYDFERGFKND